MWHDPSVAPREQLAFATPQDAVFRPRHGPWRQGKAAGCGSGVPGDSRPCGPNVPPHTWDTKRYVPGEDQLAVAQPLTRETARTQV